MVEMAIVAPILLLLLFGIAEFGIAFAQWQTLSNAAREGARVGVVFRAPCNAANVRTAITNTVQSYASSVVSATVSVTTNNLECVRGQGLQVQATAPYQFQALPGLAGISSSITLVGTSTMRNE